MAEPSQASLRPRHSLACTVPVPRVSVDEPWRVPACSVASLSLGGSRTDRGLWRARPVWSSVSCGLLALPCGQRSGDTCVLLLPGPIWAAGPQPPQPSSSASGPLCCCPHPVLAVRGAMPAPGSPESPRGGPFLPGLWPCSSCLPDVMWSGWCSEPRGDLKGTRPRPEPWSPCDPTQERRLCRWDSGLQGLEWGDDPEAWAGPESSDKYPRRGHTEVDRHRRRPRVTSACGTVAPRAGPDPRHQRPVPEGEASFVSGLAGQGPWGQLAWAHCPCGPGHVLTGSEPWCPWQWLCLLLQPSGSCQSRWPCVEGQPRSLQPGSRCACLGPVSLWEAVWPSTGVWLEDPRTEPSHAGPKVRAGTRLAQAHPEQSRARAGPVGGAAASSWGSAVRSQRALAGPEAAPSGSPLSRGCPRPAALRSPGLSWAGHLSFTVQGV